MYGSSGGGGVENFIVVGVERNVGYSMVIRGWWFGVY